MKVVYNFNGETPDGVVQYINKSLVAYTDEDSDSILFNGLNCCREPQYKEQYADYKRRCLLALWPPCEFLEVGTGRGLDQIIEDYDWFTEVYSVCPYTNKYMNKIYGYEKFKYIPYPFTNFSVEDPFVKKDTAICYFGGLHLEGHKRAVALMQKYPNKFLTKAHAGVFDPVVTHRDIPAEQKLREVSTCKLSLNLNLLQLTPAHANLVKRDSDYYQNGAFSHLDELVVPQFKVRVHESISSGAIPLVKKDHWNLIENFYTPDKDFLYYDTDEEFLEILKDVHFNYQKYEPMIESAYHRSQGYTVEKIFDYIRKDDSNLITWNQR